MTEPDDDPLDRIFVEDDDDRPEEVVVDELTTMDAGEFVERLESLATAAEAVETLTTIVEDDEMRTLAGVRLTPEQARDLASVLNECADILEGRI